MVSAALDCGQINPKVHSKHFQRLWIKNGIQSRKDGTSQPSSSFHIFLPVVRVELPFIFLGNLTNNHVTRNFNFSHKLQNLILYDWKYISSISRAMTLSYRTVYFPCCNKDIWFVSAQAEVWWHQEKNHCLLRGFLFPS